MQSPRVCNRWKKHIDVRYYHLRYKTDDVTVELSYIPADESAADVLTKAVNGPKTKLC